MPTVEQLEIAYSSQISTVAQSDASALNRVSESLDHVADTIEVTDAKITRTTKTAEDWVRSLDTVTRSATALEKAQDRLKTVTETVTEGVRRGEVTQEEASRTIDAAAERVKKLSDAHENAVQSTEKTNKSLKESGETAKISSYQFGILADEAHKFFDQVMSGGSATKAAFYQVPKMIQVLGGVGQAAELVGGAVGGPLTAGIVIATLAMYKLGSYAEAEQEQLLTLSQHLRATRDDYVAMASSADLAARKLSATSGLSLSDSRSVTATFAAVPTLNSDSFAALSSEARDLATVMGKTVPDAAKDMAAAYDNPSKAAQDFASKGLLGVHQGLVMQVQDLQNTGDRLGAWKLLMDHVGQSAAGAAEDGLTPLQKSLHDLSIAFHAPVNDAKSLAQWLGDGIDEAAAKAVRSLTNVVNAANRLRTAPLDGDDLGGITQQVSKSTDISDTIDRVGQTLGAPSDVVSLAHRIQPIESATGQYNNGHVVVSSAGAIGAMQVEPMNANGNDLYNTAGNVTAAEQYLISLYDKYKGNQILVAMAYNWGPSNVDRYLSRTTNDVPSSVLDYAQKVTGGQAYSATTLAAKRTSVDDALNTPDGSTAAAYQSETQEITRLTAAQQNLEDERKAGAISDSDYASQTQALTERLGVHRAALLNLRDPMQELVYQQSLAEKSAHTYSAAELAMVQADNSAEQAAQKMGLAHATSTQLKEAETRQQAILTDQFNVAVGSVNRLTASQMDLVAGYDATNGPLNQHMNAMQAADKVRQTSIDDTEEQVRQTGIWTDALNAATTAQSDLDTASKLYGQNLNLNLIKAQTDALGENSEAVSVQMAVLKARNDILAAGGNADSAVSKQYLDNVAATQSATNAYQRQRDTLNELTGDISSMADTLSGDFTQAFVNASAGGVTFKSALQGVESQIVSMVAKLALINPMLNAIDGGSRRTLGDISSLLSSGVGRGLVASDGFGNVSIGNDPFGGTGTTAAAFAGSGSSLSSISNGGSSLGFLGSGSSWLSSGLKTNLFGTATFGNLLGGVGAGFGLGSALGNIGGGTNGTLGSGVGSALGAIAGSFIPGIGTLIGGLIGGGAGGLVGGLLGHKKNPYTIDQVETIDGRLSLGQTWNQSQTDQITAQLKSDIASINKTLAATGASLEGGYLGTVRSDPNNKDASMRSVSLTDLLKNASLTSSDATYRQALSQGMPSDISDVSSYTAAIKSLKSMSEAVDQLGIVVSKFNDDGTLVVGNFTKQSGDLRKALDTALDGKTYTTSDLQSQIATITTFVDTTMPGLLKATVSGQQAWVDQMAALKATYDAAATQATSYGLDGGAITAKYQALYSDGYAQNMTSLRQSDASVRARYLTATGDDQGAALLNFDTSAAQQRKALSDSWQGFLGDAYKNNNEYLDETRDLEEALAAERLQIQEQYNGTSIAQMKQYDSQAQQSVTSVFANLTDYARGLGTSDVSPLSAQARYAAANDNLMADYSAAMGGDFDALSRIQGDSSSFLSQSKVYQGSGTNYATDYQKVETLLKSLGTIDADKMTGTLAQKLSQQSNDLLKGLSSQMQDLINVVETMQKQQQLATVTNATRPRVA